MVLSAQPVKEFERVEFNRLALNIPHNWNFTVNPRARLGTDQLQLFSDDRKRTIQITLTIARDDMTIEEGTPLSARTIVGHMTQVPQLRNCRVEGGGSETSGYWGRVGTATAFDFLTGKKIVFHIRVLGEDLLETGEVLFITSLVEGKECGELERIIQSLQILD